MKNIDVGTKHLAVPLLTVALALAFASAVEAQEAQQRPEPVDRARLTELVREALPSWSDSVLKIPETPKWAIDLPPEQVAVFLEDRELAAAIKEAPNGAQVFRTKGSVLRFRPEQGELRYVSHARAVDFRNDVGELPSPEESEQVVLHALARLGLPREEFVDTEAVTQAAAGGSIESREVEVRREMYRLVAVSRRLGELPVFVSDVRAAVTPEGQIQRLRINWPPVSLESDMRVVDAQNVVERAVEILAERETSAQAEVRARLGYLPKDEKDATVVLPVVLFTVLDPPTPFVFAVPVVEPGVADDE